MLSRQDWVDVRGAAACEGAKPTGHGGPSPENCRKRVFQAFQALSSHFEWVGNSKETAGKTGFWSKDEPNRMVITSPWTTAKCSSSESVCDQLGCPTTYRRDDTPTHPISENSSANDWSRGLLLRQNQLSFPTRAVVPDNGRRDDTLPPPPFPKTPRQMAVLAISRYFHFFCFHYFFLGGGHVPPTPGSPPHTPMR